MEDNVRPDARDSPPPPRRTSAQFSFTRTNIRLIYLGTIAWSLWAWYMTYVATGSAPIGPFLYRFAYIIGIFLPAAIVSYVAYILFFRSLRVSNTVFFIAFSIMLLSTAIGLNHIEQQSRLAAVDAAAREELMTAKQHYLETGETSGSAESLGRLAEGLEALSSGVGPQPRFNKVVAQLTRLMQTQNAKLDASLQRLKDLDNGGFATLSNPTELKTRISAYEAAGKELAESVLFYENLPNQFQELAKAEKLPSKEIERIKASMTEKLRLDERRQYHESHITYTKSAANFLRFLDQHNGHWQFDENQQTFVWSNEIPDEELEKFVLLVDTMVTDYETLSKFRESWMLPLANYQK